MTKLAGLKVVGIGGAGSNAVTYMLRRDPSPEAFVVMNTDAHALMRNPSQHKVALGEQGAENAEAIAAALAGVRVAVLVAGMGGGTGTKTLPMVAQKAREMGIFTVCMVTMPFAFEGPRRGIAEDGVAIARRSADQVIVFENDDLLKTMPHGLSMGAAFDRVNEALYQGALYIAGLPEGEDAARLRQHIEGHDFFAAL